MSGTEHVRVAVIGARGIGRHHAKWWALEGADVCAFAGTSAESIAAARKGLEDLFPFAGRGYTSVEEMLDIECPDIVDVCSPPALHGIHIRAALDAGCHVLCEKPFVYDAGKDRADLVGQARALVGLAAQKGLHLGICTQYSAGATMFGALWAERGGVVSEYLGRLESPAKNRPPDPARVWVDLSPHPISVLLRVAPGGRVDWASLRTRFEGYEARAEFCIERPAGPPLHCVVATRNNTEPPLNVRHFEYDGYAFHVEGENDATGVYRSRIETPDGPHIRLDMMHQTIRDFLAGEAVTGEEAVANLEIMLRVLEQT